MPEYVTQEDETRHYSIRSRWIGAVVVLTLTNLVTLALLVKVLSGGLK